MKTLVASISSLASLAQSMLLGSSVILAVNLPLALSASAHEKSFPSKQLKAVSPEGEDLTFKEIGLKPDSNKLKEYEKQYGFTFAKGELEGSLFVGAGSDKKPKVVAVFLDGKSDRGDTEFGATVSTAGKLLKARAFSSPEAAESTSQAFFESLIGKSADELDALRKSFGPNEKSKQYIAELAQKAVLRVSASFAKK